MLTLVKTLRRRGIADVSAGSGYLTTEYSGAHNARFACPAASSETFHVPSPPARQLDAVFRVRQSRRASNDWVVRHHGRFFQLDRVTWRRPRCAAPSGCIVQRSFSFQPAIMAILSGQQTGDLRA